MSGVIVPTAQPTIPQRYLLRCRFDYTDRAKPWYSMWNKGGETPATQAWRNKRDGYLLMATIEGKEIESRRIVPLAACEGKDFLNFEWVGQVRTAAGATGTFKAAIIGLLLVTPEATVRVTVDGRIHVDRTPPRSEGMHYSVLGV